MTTQPFHSGFAAIVGRPNVGKSTLLNAILGEKIVITSDKPQTTRNRIQGIHNIPTGQIVFVDTPGVHRAKSRLNRSLVDTAMEAIQGVDVILFLVEANSSPAASRLPGRVWRLQAPASCGMKCRRVNGRDEL